MKEHKKLIPPRTLLARYLVGSGIELGPGHHPFELPLPGVHVTYVDRWHGQESQGLFPQVHGAFKEPDVVADFNTDRLSAIDDGSQDFVVASHLLEHLAEPIGFLAEIHRVLRLGGVTLILLPDRHRTKDLKRTPTALSHLVSEFETGTTEVSDAHLIDFLEDRGIELGATQNEQQETLDRHRKRSIHVHCWDAKEFLELILWTIANLDLEWEFVDGSLPIDSFPAGIEFSFVLRRSSACPDAATRSQRCKIAWQQWSDARISPALAAEIWLKRAYYKARITDRRVRRLIRSRLSGK